MFGDRAKNKNKTLKYDLKNGKQSTMLIYKEPKFACF